MQRIIIITARRIKCMGSFRDRLPTSLQFSYEKKFSHKKMYEMFD